MTAVKFYSLDPSEYSRSSDAVRDYYTASSTTSPRTQSPIYGQLFSAALPLTVAHVT